MKIVTANGFRLAMRASPLLLTLLGAGAASADTAQGFVFADDNRNGEFDDGEQGLAGVGVSNGRGIALTDQNGRYAIDIENDEILFVVKPTDYRVPVDAHRLPQFFYRHYPNGTPSDLNLRYPGVPASGPLPERIDFPLYHEPEPRDFQVVLFADTQPQTAREVDFIRDDVIGELLGIDAAFGMTLGDIAFDDLSVLPRLNALIGAIGIPWYNVPGNHELNFPAPDDSRSLETFKRYYGPAYYAFDYGGVHFVVLDDVDYRGTAGAEGMFAVRGQGPYEGRIGEVQLAWLKADLAQVANDRLVILAMHIPLDNYNDPDSPARSVLNRRELFKVLRGRARLFSLAGHMHVSEHHYFGRAEGFGARRPLHHHTIGTVSGSWWSGPLDARGIPLSVQRDGTPNGYYIMSITDGEPVLRFKAASEADDRQMRITLDRAYHQIGDGGLLHLDLHDVAGGELTRDELPAARVTVNLFNGGPQSTVEMHVDDGEPIRLSRVLRPDPYIQALFLEERASLKSWVRAEPSSHLWEGRLPEDLAPGTHRLHFRAVDEYGRTHTAARVIELTR